MADRYPGRAGILDVARRPCPDGRFTRQVDGVQGRSDGVHLTPQGARLLAPWLASRPTDAAR